MKKYFCVAAILLCVFRLFATAPVTDIKILRAEAHALAQGRDTRWLEIDSNGDGQIDHIMLLNKRGDKIYEELDYNHDSEMDDFCYYQNGALVREETDSNYDGMIDIWLFLYRGIYVERYMRDMDFDGAIDVTKEYGPKK
jgi:hypothetical protein